NEPGDILRTFASTIDYQFGFKVSETWFYRLLEKAVLPLVIFSILSLYALSCIVVVGPGHQGIIEHFGAYQKTVDAGLHLKLPWPFDVAIIHPTDLVQQINIGFVDTAHAGEEEKRPPLLWGEKHYDEEYNLLVAADTEGSSREGSVAISIVIAAVPVQYRVRDIKAFMYNHRDSKETLEAICYRELVRYAASARIETDGDDEGAGGGELSILGAGRQHAANVLSERIQQEVDREGLGIEIVFLGLQGVHPPQEVAKAYQEVIGAVQQKQAAILDGMASENAILISLGGKSVQWAEELADLAGRYRQAREAGDAELGESLMGQLKEAFARSSGDVFTTLRAADGYSFEKAVLAEATGKRFDSQVKAYRASPQIYKRNQRLAMLEETLPGIRKYVIVSGNGGKQVIIIDVQEDLTPSLFDMNMDLSGR
ncbi:MAG: protease modulator HflK, partial [Planctomycetes bacterium]|nr:protease modulator HflK [Planctomycetota bacterium]